MEQILPLIMQQGPLGVMTGLFIYLYMAERSKNTELQAKLNRIHEANYLTLDKIREGQIRREQEIGHTLEEYGKGVIDAVQQSTVVSEELRRLHRGQR